MTRRRLHIADPEGVSRRLRQARERAGLTQRQLAEGLCSPPYLSRIEAGDRAPSLQILRELARRLEVSVDWLATGKEGAQVGDRVVQAAAALRVDELELAEGLLLEELEAATTARERALALELLGQVHFRRGEQGEAIARLEEALALFAEAATLRSELGNTLGRAYAAAGQLESAIGTFERFLAAAREREDTLDAARFSVLLAYALEDAGNFGRAEELLGWVLAREDLVDLRTRIGTYWAQSRLHILQHDAGKAEASARRVLALAELEDDTFYLALAHRLLAHVELDRQRPEAALELLAKGEAILRPFGNVRELASFHLDEARARAALGELERARELALGAAGTLADADPTDAGRGYAVVADAFAAAGEPEHAIELYELACEFLERMPSRYLIDAYTRLAELMRAAGRKDEELDVLRRALRVQSQVGRALTPAE